MTAVPGSWVQIPLSEIRADRTTSVDPAACPGEQFDLLSLPAHDNGSVEHLPGVAIGSTKKLLAPGTVVISKINPRISRVAVVGPSRGFRQLGSSEWIPFSPTDGLLPEYLAYFLRQEAVRAHLAANVSGVGGSLMRTNAVVIGAIRISIAPYPEQLRIVDAVESYLSRLDAAVASLEHATARLKAYRASVLKAAVEGRLVPTEAALARQEGRAYEPAHVLLDRILAERRCRWEEAELARLTEAGKPPKDDNWKAKYEEPEPPDSTDLPELPSGWCWASIDQLLIGGPQNGLYVPKSKYGTGVPIVRIDDYQPDWSRASAQLQRVTVSDEVRDTYALAVGDLVLNRVNSPSHLGKTLLVEPRHLPAVFESNMMRFRLSVGVASGYAQLYLSSPGGKGRLLSNAKWAVNQASINQQDVSSCAVPLPPFEEQQRVVAEVDRLISTSEAIKGQAIDDLRRCSRLSQAILCWAFDGRLVDQDSTDDPAQTLLDRIRAARTDGSLARNSRSRRTKVKS